MTSDQIEQLQAQTVEQLQAQTVLLPSERRSKLDSERLGNQAPSVYCGALKHGAS